jgi:hypothetical protein
MLREAADADVPSVDPIRCHASKITPARTNHELKGRVNRRCSSSHSSRSVPPAVKSCAMLALRRSGNRALSHQPVLPLAGGFFMRRTISWSMLWWGAGQGLPTSRRLIATIWLAAFLLRHRVGWRGMDENPYKSPRGPLTNIACIAPPAWRVWLLVGVLALVASFAISRMLSVPSSVIG